MRLDHLSSASHIEAIEKHMSIRAAGSMLAQSALHLKKYLVRAELRHVRAPSGPRMSHTDTLNLPKFSSIRQPED